MNRLSSGFSWARGAFGIALLIAGSAAIAPAQQVIFDSFPSPLPGNVPSEGFQCCQVNELGDGIVFSPGSQRKLQSVKLNMSSWACQHSGGVSCSTTPGSTYSWPITMNIRAVSPGPAPGALLATLTQSFNIPFRPSADNVNCAGGAWFDATDNACYNGFLFPISFDFSAAGITLPDQVIVSIVFNTTTWGPNPQTSDPCQSSPDGCPYDSLNIAVSGTTAQIKVGTNVDPNGIFVNFGHANDYCDGGAGGFDVFRLDTPCWTNNHLQIQVTASTASFLSASWWYWYVL